MEQNMETIWERELEIANKVTDAILGIDAENEIKEKNITDKKGQSLIRLSSMAGALFVIAERMQDCVTAHSENLVDDDFFSGGVEAFAGMVQVIENRLENLLGD